jgi:hypothetical protein
MAMRSARGVEIDTIDELIAADLATATIGRVGRSAIEITHVKITEAGRRALFELQYCGPAAGMIDSFDEAKAAFRRAWERHEGHDHKERRAVRTPPP